MTAWHEEPISKKHELRAFDSGDDELNRFLNVSARRSHAWHGLETFLAVDDRETRTVMGFYSLGVMSVGTCTPAVAPWGVLRRKHLGVRLKYLAVDRSFRRRGLGGQLLLAAGRRCLLASSQTRGLLLLLAAPDNRASTWFASYGAVPLLDTPRFLVLPLASIEAALQGARRRKEQTPEPFEPAF